jgi:hypothetical protein
LPLPLFAFLAVAAGVATAFAGGNELRLSPRHALLTSTFFAFACYLGLLMVPASAYFYIFHGDWFLLYAFDVRLIPSAIALVGFVLLALLGVLGFSLGAGLARSQRTAAGGLAIALCVLASAALAIVLRDRMALVGSYAQYRGGFGLQPYGGTLLQGTLAMVGYLGLGLTFLLLRVRAASARN